MLFGLLPATLIHVFNAFSALSVLSNTAEASDEMLMQAYCDGDVRAFDALYLRHKGALWRYLSRLIGSSAEGEELFQDAWAKVVSARNSFSHQHAFKAWLFKIGHNLAMDRIRHRSIAPEHSIESDADHVVQLPDASELQPEALNLSQEAHARLLKQLDELPVEQREVVLLRAEGELTLEEIGALTGLGRETIKSRLRYALAKLKAGLQQ